MEVLEYIVSNEKNIVINRLMYSKTEKINEINAIAV